MFVFEIIVLFHLFFGLSINSKVPWLEQISRQEYLSNGCASYINSNEQFNFSLKSLRHLLVDVKHRFLYCYVPKVGCTNWKRVLMVLTDKSKVKNLSEIPANVAHALNSTLSISDLSEFDANVYLNNFTSFLMVRHPFERLLSAFRNKFEENTRSSEYFQIRIGRYIIQNYRSKATLEETKNGNNVTFREFAQYLIREGVKDKFANEHWLPISELCRPCFVNYTFIGKYEWFEEDAKTVLNMIGAPYVDFPISKPKYTREKMSFYFQQLSLREIEQLYNIYKLDFKLFDYDLNSIVGYEFG